MRALVTAVLMVLAAGCGQKGPLFLPEADPVPAQQQQPTPEEDDKSGEADNQP